MPRPLMVRSVLLAAMAIAALGVTGCDRGEQPARKAVDETRDPPARAEPPSLLLVDGNTLVERTAGDSRTVAQIDDLGGVLVGATVGEDVYLLQRRGLLRISGTDGGSEVVLSTEDSVGGSLIVSAGSGKIAVVQEYPDTALAWLVNPPSQPRQVAAQSQRPLGFSEQPDSLWFQNQAGRGLSRLVFSTGEVEKLAVPSPGMVASLSPDAKKGFSIGYSPDRGSTPLAMYELTSNPPRLLWQVEGAPAPNVSVQTPVWAPDGRAVFVWVRSPMFRAENLDLQEPHFGIWRMDASEGTMRQLTNASTAALGFVSADGRWLFVRDYEKVPEFPGNSIRLGTKAGWIDTTTGRRRDVAIAQGQVVGWPSQLFVQSAVS